MSTPAVAQLTEAATHLIASKYYAIASFTMFAYDIVLTIPLIVEKIWTKQFTGLTVLWFFNRWFFLAGVIITYVAYLDPNWGGAASVPSHFASRKYEITLLPHSCDKFFRYPGYTIAVERITVGSIFALRTYCIYNRDKRPAATVAIFVVIEFVVKLVSLQLWGAPVQLPTGLTSCILAVTPQNASKFIGFWVTELCTDGVICFATIYRSYVMYWKNEKGSLSSTYLWKVIVKDGLLYFAIMFTTNLVTVIQYLTLPQDLKAINANFGAVSTSLLAARLVLNLKIAATQTPSRRELYSGFQGHRSAWEETICGPLGNELEGTSSDGDKSTTAEDYELYKI